MLRCKAPSHISGEVEYVFDIDETYCWYYIYYSRNVYLILMWLIGFPAMKITIETANLTVSADEIQSSYNLTAYNQRMFLLRQ